MHVAVFVLIHLAAAVAVGVMAVLDGHGVFGTLWRVAATLIALQAAYALWLLAVAWIAPPSSGDPASNDSRTEHGRKSPGLGQRPRDQLR
jgi:hypothetical protein